MSEIKKNIETCRGEDVLAEVSALPQDPHFGSLVNEALDPLKQQALHQEGWDGYSEVIEQHKPYTFASSIIQMKSNLLLLFRALWQFPFGSGTRSLSDDASLRSLSDDASLRSLADMWQHYITRLSGNETYGIPSRLSSLTDLPSAPLLVADRKISGVPEAEDGMSLVHLTYSAQTITELTDDNVGWVLNRPITTSPFANLVKLKIGCKEAHLGSQSAVVVNVPTLQSLELPELEIVTGNTSSYGLVYGTNQVSYLSAPKLKYAGGVFEYGLIYNCQLEELYLPEFIGFTYTYRTQLLTNCPTIKKINCPKFQQNVYGSILQNCPNIEEIYVPSTENIASVTYEGNMLKDLVHLRVFVAKALRQNGNAESFEGCTNLIHIEVGDGIAENIALNAWSPTNALDASRTDLIEEGSTAQNNLQQFLSNFRTYIAERLADNGSGKTLTLSKAVRNAIHAAESTYGIENIIITQKGWTISPAPN